MQSAATAPQGWLVAVLLEIDGEPEPLVHYFGVGHADQAKCEWKAIDRAGQDGRVATSPRKGVEPVKAVRALTLAKMRMLGLAAGEVRALGWRYPRRWLS